MQDAVVTREIGPLGVCVAKYLEWKTYRMCLLRYSLVPMEYQNIVYLVVRWYCLKTVMLLVVTELLSLVGPQLKVGPCHL